MMVEEVLSEVIVLMLSVFSIFGVLIIFDEEYVCLYVLEIVVEMVGDLVDVVFDFLCEEGW